MRHWPLSTIAQSPLMHPAYAADLRGAYQRPQLSQGAMIACNQVAGETAACNTPIFIIESVGAAMHRVYLGMPAPEDFALLERGGFVATDETFGFVVDALH